LLEPYQWYECAWPIHYVVCIVLIIWVHEREDRSRGAGRL
jgi:hypothetical protein